MMMVALMVTTRVMCLLKFFITNSKEIRLVNCTANRRNQLLEFKSKGGESWGVKVVCVSPDGETNIMKGKTTGEAFCFHWSK